MGLDIAKLRKAVAVDESGRDGTCKQLVPTTSILGTNSYPEFLQGPSISLPPAQMRVTKRRNQAVGAM
jgi:hypothetical protein